MPGTKPLLVPVSVQALAVNTPVLGKETFRRWIPNLKKLQYDHRESVTNLELDQSDDGVYLYWRLPSALKTGRPAPSAGTQALDTGLHFPLIPNRWLVIRYTRETGNTRSQPEAAGWIVHSDFLSTGEDDEEEGTSRFIHPWKKDEDGNFLLAEIGRRHTLTEMTPWQEPSSAPEMFLTSNGPGLLDFSEYQPYNEDVLSIHDTLEDLGADKWNKSLTLSYLVIGWYSDPAKDIFTPDPADPEKKNADALLTRLGWQHAAGAADPAAALTAALGWDSSAPSKEPHALYCGSLLGLTWEQGTDKDAPPASDRPTTPREVTISVGSTPVEGQMAHLRNPNAQDNPEHRLTPEELDLFEAFQNDWLQTLSDEHSFQTALEQARPSARFGSFHGGYRWEIVRNPETPSLTSQEQTVLDALNTVQRQYDLALGELSDARQRLYGLWWLSTDEEWDSNDNRQFDPEQPNTVAHAVREKILEIAGHDGLRSRLPLPADGQSLSESIRAYETAHNLRADSLRCVSLPPFHLPHPPSVVFRGLKGLESLTGPEPLPCRTPDQTVTSITVGPDTIESPATVPAPNLSGLPAPDTLKLLIKEFFVLDRASATPNTLKEIRNTPARLKGTLPEFTRNWSQPWLPLHLQWTVTCNPLPYEDWEFTKDATYQLKTAQSPQQTQISGTTPLIPLLEFLTHARAQELDSTPSTSKLSSLVESQKDQLSVTLQGINEYFAGRGTRANLAPTDPVLQLLGPGPYYPIPDSEALYQTVRAGQFSFTDLTIVDRFGRSFNIIESSNAQYANISVAPDMTPTNDKSKIASAQDPHLVVQLPPRLHQGARLRFDPVSARNDNRIIDLDTDNPDNATPICAWIIPNRLTTTPSLLVYTAQGQGLGELRPAWTPYPDAPYPSLTGPSGDAFKKDHPQLHEFLTALSTAGQNALTSLTTELDKILPNIAPPPADLPRHLAPLLGRPLALLRTRLTLELNGPRLDKTTPVAALTTPGSPSPDLWHVKIGAHELAADGLVGYFHPDYSRLRLVSQPSAQNSYLTPITGDDITLTATPPTTSTNTTGTCITLLADPQSTIHAYTDIVPPTELRLPPQFLDKAFANLTPLLATGLLLASRSGHTITAPCPDTAAWTWSEPTLPTGENGNTVWEKYTLTGPKTQTGPSQDPPEARTGYLAMNQVQPPKP
ncbi:hypothetical protein [Streptomyces murinus]|uniref:hypothetical protein n=1 Tax=Streptomyces murinus TaxID=33900 RepID=UPI003F48FF4A